MGRTSHFALRTGQARPMLVGVPHPVHELLTLQEGLAAFAQLQPRALVVSGTHRCANLAPSGCEGSTSVCGPTAPHGESDPAHAVQSAFHRAHVSLAGAYDDLVVLSLHGNSSDGVSLSDGTINPTSASSVLADTAALLAAAFPTDTITTCSAGASVPQDLRLCGITNVQGRLVNGSPEPCTTATASASGHFLHLEQSPAVRGDYEPLIDALDQSLP